MSKDYRLFLILLSGLSCTFLAKIILPQTFIYIAIPLAFFILCITFENKNFVADNLNPPTSYTGRVFILIYIAAGVGAYGLSGSPDISPPPLSSAEEVSRFVSQILLAPIAEEFFFRGLVQKEFLKRLSRDKLDSRKTIWAIYTTALWFWVFHFPVHPHLWSAAWEKGGLPLSPGPFLLGLCTGWVAWKDQSLRWAIVFHILANLCGPLWIPILQKLNVTSFFYS